MMSILRPHWPEKGNAVAGPLTPPLDSSSSAFRQRNHSTAALALNGANKTLRVGVHNPRLRCKTTPLVIGETSSASSHVLPENSILFFKIFDRILLEPVDPAGEGHDEQLQKVGLHGPDSSRSWRHPCLAPAVSQLPARARHCANRVLAHYGVLVVMILEMVQDLPDDAGLGDERNDAHFAAAVFANQRVGLEHTVDQVGPSSTKGSALGGVELVVVGCMSFFWEYFLLNRA